VKKHRRTPGQNFWRKSALALWLVLAAAGSLCVLAEMSVKGRSRVLDHLWELFWSVGLMAFVGSIIEIRNWTRFVSFLVGPLARFGRLPDLAGAAMLTALFSDKAASSLLSTAYGDGHLSRRSMRIGGMCNSYFAFLSHSLRVLYPVVAVCGWAGTIYFALQFSTGFLFILLLLYWHRRSVGTGELENSPTETPHIPVSDKSSWPEVIKQSAWRTSRIMWRMLIVTVPLYLGVTYLQKHGAFEVIEKWMPSGRHDFLNAQVVAIAVAQLGGLVSAATIAADYQQHQGLGTLQVLLAFLLGSLFGNPVRTLRRNLPSAMGIYPPKDGFVIVVTMQVARAAICAVLIALVWLLLLAGFR